MPEPVQNSRPAPTALESSLPVLSASASPSSQAQLAEATTSPALRVLAGEEQAAGKVREAVAEIIEKLFLDRGPSNHRRLYEAEVAHEAKRLETTAEELLQRARAELADPGTLLELLPDGKLNLDSLPPHLSAVLNLLQNNVDYYLISSHATLDSDALPLSASVRREFGAIVDRGECAMLLIAKAPPREVADEIRRISEEQLKDLMSLWADPRVRSQLQMSDGLKEYLQHATVRVLCTGSDVEANRAARSLNEALERDGGFESLHWLRLLKSVAEGEKAESLKQTFKVCVPVVIGVKALEHYLPGMLHVVGGVLDDLFGAIIPDVSQSMGDPNAPWRERLKKAGSVLKGGLVSLPLAMAFGATAAWIHHAFPSAGMQALAGVLFALACSAGTIGTSIGALSRARRSIHELAEQSPISGALRELSAWSRMKLAFREAILDVPFRIGHTLLGVPLQIGLGVWAGLGGFFSSPWFVGAEGILETAAGVLTAFAYPFVARFFHYRHLQRSSLR